MSLSIWNRKLHIYIGLYMLLFLWLFSVSGLFMNNPSWFPHQAERSEREQAVQLPNTSDDQEKAENLAQQLGLSGEVVLFARQRRADSFAFRVVRGSQIITVSTHLQNALATIRTRNAEPTAVIELLHTFTGVRPIWGEQRPVRDWFMTQIWSFSIDVLSLGLLFLVVSSLYLWYELKQKRLSGFIAFGLGILTCGFFIWGLGWMT